MTASPGEGNQAQSVQVKQACTVLYHALPALDASALQNALAEQLGKCSVEWAEGGKGGLPITAGVVQFGPHRIAMIALDAPVKEDVLARTVGVSPMPDERRAELINHKATIRLLYVGEAADAVGQLTALYRVAGVLVMQGGLGILNERAALAQPAELVELYLGQLGGDPPPLSMWVGAVTFNHEDEPERQRYFMRTYGMEQFGLPELGHGFGEREAADNVYHVLINVGLYMVENAPSVKIEPGQTAEFLKRTYLFTTPQGDKPEFGAPTGLLLLVQV